MSWYIILTDTSQPIGNISSHTVHTLQFNIPVLLNEAKLLKPTQQPGFMHINMEFDYYSEAHRVREQGESSNPKPHVDVI